MVHFKPHLSHLEFSGSVGNTFQKSEHTVQWIVLKCVHVGRIFCLWDPSIIHIFKSSFPKQIFQNQINCKTTSELSLQKGVPILCQNRLQILKPLSKKIGPTIDVFHQASHIATNVSHLLQSWDIQLKQEISWIPQISDTIWNVSDS